jgi:hypothetical protein
MYGARCGCCCPVFAEPSEPVAKGDRAAIGKSDQSRQTYAKLTRLTLFQTKIPARSARQKTAKATCSGKRLKEHLCRLAARRDVGN